MKELTIEQKAKKYDEALKKAKDFYKGYKQRDNQLYADDLESIFPELKEDGDEKIRKGIVKYLEQSQFGEEHYCVDDDIVREYIAWLEKQGENNNNKIEPKFHKGDWIVHYGTENIYQIVAVIDNQYQIKYGNNYTTQYCTDVDRCARLWDITKDAKDGDVLCYKDEISLYKHDIRNCAKQETIFGGFVYYCCYDGKRFIIDSLYSLTEQDKLDIHPATKEQRDALMKAMTESSYTFDFEKKKLKKIEQKTTWSEEDEIALGDALWCCKQAASIAKDENDMSNIWYAEDWLKSLKERV